MWVHRVEERDRGQGAPVELRCPPVQPPKQSSPPLLQPLPNHRRPASCTHPASLPPLLSRPYISLSLSPPQPSNPLPINSAGVFSQVAGTPAAPARPRRSAAILQCSQFYGPRTVLLGDAAHGVTGALGPVGLTGQGASAAIESVRTLALVLRGAQVRGGWGGLGR